MPLLTLTDFALSTTRTRDAFSNDPTIARLPDGGFAVTWESQAGIIARRFSSTGTALGDEITVSNTPAATDETQAAIAVLPDGRFMVAWESNWPFSDVSARFYNADGTPSGASFMVHEETEYTQKGPEVLALSGDRYLVTWIDYEANPDVSNPDVDRTHITAKIYSAAGVELAGEFRISAAEANEYQAFQDATVLADGKIALTWFSVDSSAGGLTSIHARVLNADGSAFSSELFVGIAGDRVDDPAITALAGGGFAVAWTDDDGSTPAKIKMRTFNAQAQATTTSAFAVPGSVGIEPSGASRSSILLLPDDRLMVAWTVYEAGTAASDIFVQVLSETGVPAGVAYKVNSTIAGSQNSADLALLSDGRVSVVWGSSAPGTGEVRGTIIDPLRFVGTSVADVWNGGRLADQMNGATGDDRLSGFGGNDLIYGDDGMDVLSGGDGDDRLFGGNGLDRMTGGAGTDTLTGGAGADALDGGTGTDTASYYNDGAVTVALDGSYAATGAAVGDGLRDIENLSGSNAGSDWLVGNAVLNVIYGNGGADTLVGRAGSDKLIGGAGVDRYAFFAALEGGDAISTFETGEVIMVEGSAFSLGAYAGVLNAANFISRVSGHAASDANDYFIFDQSNDTLWYDFNGSGARGDVMIADLNNFAFTSANVLVV
jgi:hypothetical protein